MSQLAINGGRSLRDAKADPWPRWPIWDENEEKGLLDVLRSGVWSYNGPKEKQFNKAFAEFIGTKYSVSVANGTVSLQLALEACGVGLGDEVIVPGLTWQATAGAVLDVNAVPVLVDVSSDNWCIDPAEVEKAITQRSKAVIPVHLYGCFADVDAIMAIARKHNLRVIEDCAHKHGGELKGRKAGSIGDAGSFSFQLSKLITAGEGGAVTTSDPELFEKLDALRNCGRRPEREESADKGAGLYGSEGDFIQSGNYRITDFQSALLVEELKRLPEQNRIRGINVKYLNSLLEELPGVRPMMNDQTEELGACYNFSFRYNKDDFKGLDIKKFREAMSKELDCSVEASYEPLNTCSLYTPGTKPKRHKLSEEYWKAIDPVGFELPICHRIFSEESVCFHHSVLLGPKTDMDLIAGAIEKIYNNTDELM